MTESRSGIAAALAGTALLSAAAPTTISALATASRLRTLRRDEVLFTADSRANAAFVVTRGTMRVFTTSANGTEPMLAILTPGDLVGEIGVLDDVPRAASVAAMRPSEVVEVPGRAFREAYHTDPAIPRRLVSLLSARMRALNDGFTDLASLDLGGRLAKYLVGECEQQGRTTVKLTLTQTELGQLLGGARQSVNQVLQSLERNGLIETRGRTVHVLDLPGLRSRGFSPKVSGT